MASGKPRRGPLFSAIVPVLAVLTTWLTGFWQTGSTEYGFPLPWKTVYLRSCLLCPPTSFLPYSYIWLNFALDTILYAAIGYGLILGYVRYHAWNAAALRSS